MTATDLAVDVLAGYRLTRLAVVDTITEPARTALSARSTFLDDMLACEHCTGVWIAAGVTVARTVAPRAWRPVAHALAVAGGVSVMASLVRRAHTE